MSNPNSDLVYLVPALEDIRQMLTLAQRYADGELDDDEFKSAWADTSRRNAVADLLWLKSNDG